MGTGCRRMWGGSTPAACTSSLISGFGILLLTFSADSSPSLESTAAKAFDDANSIRDFQWGHWAPHDEQWYQTTRRIFARHALSKQPPEKMLIPRIIHQVWIGGELPHRFQRLAASWKRLHPDWEYKLWTDSDVKGLRLRNRELFERAKNPGQKSDILRLEVLYQYGGLYVDTDFECLKSFESSLANLRFFG